MATAPRLRMAILPGGPQWSAGRTRRACAALGIAADPGADGDGAWLWLLRAGTWPTAVPEPRTSATGRPTALIGLSLPADAAATPEPDADAWRAWIERSGGDGDRSPPPGVPASLLLDPDLAARWRRLGPDPAPEALAAMLAGPGIRLARWQPADVLADRRARIAEVVTSLQRGGAERIVLDLATHLPRHGLHVQVIVTGMPGRAAWPAPPGTIDVARSGDRAARLAAVVGHAQRLGIDVVHAHLLGGADLAALTAGGPPLAVTIHNAAPGWPADLAAMPQGALAIACSHAVAADLADRLPAITCRTAWNGIDPRRAEATPARTQAAAAQRRDLGLADGDLVALVLANPRRQKRLDLLPAILADPACPARLHLVIAGDGGTGGDAIAAEAALAAQIGRHRIADRIHRIGAVEDVGGILAAADLLLAPSAWEGLSLSQLEALAAGVPVIASDVGGAREVAERGGRIELLAATAGAADWAQAIARTMRPGGQRQPSLPASFTVAAMATTYARLLPRAAAWAQPRRPGEGIWLVTNNLSTGGAQSSARRLLQALHADGVRVRCALLQEDPGHPTPGRQELLRSGIAVLALPPPDRLDATAAVQRLAAAIDDDPPRSVLLWNAMPRHKVLLAEALDGVALWDVSPGEMNFASLDRLFAALPPDLPLRSLRDYGARLAGAVVKWSGEAAQAAAAFGRPVAVVPNGVPLPAPRTSPRLGPCVIGTAVRLAPHKRLEDLLAALRLAHPRMPPYELRIAGGPDGGDLAYADRLRAEAGDLPVRFVGEQSDVAPFLADLDLFVLVAEPAGCPNASLEAMAHGLAVIATAVGGMGEQVEHGRTGLLVPPRDPVALADALVALAGDRGLRERLGGVGRQRIAEHFTVARMAADYRRVCLGHG